VVEMLAQHARIRGLAMELGDELGQQGVQWETVRKLGEQLEAHIRLEERRCSLLSRRHSPSTP